MSITPSVQMPRVPVAVFVLVGVAVVLASAPDAAAARSARPFLAPSVGAVPAPTPATLDPAARLASLDALLRTRTADAANAAARRDGLQRRLGETQTLAEQARARTDALSQKAAQAQERADRAQVSVNQLAAAAYRDGSDGGPIVRLFSTKSAAELAYSHEIARRVGHAQQRMIRIAKRQQA